MHNFFRTIVIVTIMNHGDTTFFNNPSPLDLYSEGFSLRCANTKIFVKEKNNISNYVYVYVCMLSLRRAIASACVAGVINIMVGDDQRVDDHDQSCTVGSI